MPCHGPECGNDFYRYCCSLSSALAVSCRLPTMMRFLQHYCKYTERHHGRALRAFLFTIEFYHSNMTSSLVDWIATVWPMRCGGKTRRPSQLETPAIMKPGRCFCQIYTSHVPAIRGYSPFSMAPQEHPVASENITPASRCANQIVPTKGPNVRNWS